MNGFKRIRGVYESVDPDYNLRWTIPVLYDKKLKTIINNESSEIIRILNTFPRDKTDDVKDIYSESLPKSSRKRN